MSPSACIVFRVCTTRLVSKKCIWIVYKKNYCSSKTTIFVKRSIDQIRRRHLIGRILLFFVFSLIRNTMFRISHLDSILVNPLIGIGLIVKHIRTLARRVTFYLYGFRVDFAYSRPRIVWYQFKIVLLGRFVVENRFSGG